MVERNVVDDHARLTRGGRFCGGRASDSAGDRRRRRSRSRGGWPVRLHAQGCKFLVATGRFLLPARLAGKKIAL